jgi:hypothetical protein
VQKVQSAECNIASVTVGNDELSGLRMLGVLGRQMFRETASGLVSYED